MPFDQSSFLSPWRAAIKEAGERHKPSFPCWEGPKAYKDLKRAGLLNYILFQKEGSWFGGEQDWRSKKLFEQFEAAVAIYEADVQEFSKLRSESSAPNDLGNAARSLRPLTAGRYSRKIKGTATKLLQMLEDEVSWREQVNQRKRDEAFFAGLYGLSAALKEYVTAPNRGWDLDARFQVKIGFLLNFHFRDSAEKRTISLQTISRSVVLFYIASGLADYAPAPLGQKQIKTVRLDEADRVTVRVQAVDQNLRRARLNKFHENKGPYRD